MVTRLDDLVHVHCKCLKRDHAIYFCRMVCKWYNANGNKETCEYATWLDWAASAKEMNHK